MTTAEKIAAIEASDLRIAWDGCHKIYLLATAAELTDAADTGYTCYGPTEIRRIVSDSCGLVFVHPWSLGPSELDIEQGTEDIYEAAGRE